MHFCLQFVSNAKNGLHTHSLHLMQHPIDAMLQFDPNAHANVDASMNEALRVNRTDKTFTHYLYYNQH